MSEKLDWERIAEDTHRLKVLNGWVIRHTIQKTSGYESRYSKAPHPGGMATSMTFVPDVRHLWDLEGGES